MENQYPRGSEWRKWDLHVHTPESKLNNQFGNDWDVYIKTLFNKAIENKIAVIGITDYFTIEGYKKIKQEYLNNDEKLKVLFEKEFENDPSYIDAIKRILILPNIEFRLNNIIHYDNGTNKKLQYHVIFDNSVSIEDIENYFLHKICFNSSANNGKGVDKSPLTLKSLQDHGKQIKNIQKEFEDKSDIEAGMICADMSFENICNILNESSNRFNNKYLLIVVEDDITNIKWGDQSHMTRKILYTMAHGIFSSNDKSIAWGLQDTTKDEFSSYKPCFKGSDAHDLQSLFSFSNNKYCWIKADPTFDGLYQCTYQPEERVFVGSTPIKLDKANKNKRTYIESIQVNKCQNAKNTMENWFDFNLPINSGLTVIIGNKGSGKSALSDIIGYLCQSSSIEHASFLNPKRFRNSPKNLANDYEGYISWLDGQKDEIKSLNDKEYSTSIESAQYLPQKYIEIVCNELGQEFQEEINSVIFSYVDATEKGSAKNLDELINSKSFTINSRIRTLQDELEEINSSIIECEDNLVSSYKKGLEDNLKKRMADLTRHEKNVPDKIEKPKNDQSEDYVAELELLDNQIGDIEKEIESAISEATELNQRIQELNFLKEEISELGCKAESLNIKLLHLVPKYNFNTKDFIIIFTAPIVEIEEKIGEINTQLVIMQLSLNNSDDADEKSSLYKKMQNLTERKENLISESDAGEKAYQKYLIDIKEWEKAKVEILGNSNIDGTIEYYKTVLEYVNNGLVDFYTMQKKERLSKVEELFKMKQFKADIYSSIYKPVEKELSKLLNSMEDNVEFAVNISISDKEVQAKLLNYISKTHSGIFNGKTESQNKMNEIVNNFNFNISDDVCAFVTNVLKCIDEDYEVSSKKVRDKIGFYKLLTSLDYLDAEYSLKMGGKSLEELSAGQRGIVLLIFYLALSKNQVPIIIDQPEDNLDNQSVYDKLVQCICEAKKKRQVIIVTHNPNIAIACDAEQIIYCEISKHDNRIEYISGSIENEEIRNKVINVLEGTKPAFNLRKRKYSIHE